MALSEYKPGTAFPGRIGRTDRRVEPRVAAAGPGGAGFAERAVHRPGRHRVRAARLLRQPDRHPAPRLARGRRPALQPHAHDGALLAVALLRDHRPQPPLQRDGRDHRARHRLPGLRRQHPVRERVPVRDAAAARLQHLHDRQVAPDAVGAGVRRRSLRPLAAGPRLRPLLRLPRRRHQPVVSRPRPRQPPGGAAAQPRGGLPPDRRPGRPRHLLHRRRQAGGPGQALLPALLHRRDARAAPRREGMGRPLRRALRRGLGGLPQRGVRPAEAARRRARGRGALPPRPRRPRVGVALAGRPQAGRPDDGGLRGLPVAHRRPDRAAAGLPARDRRARQHPDHGRVRQRSERRGRGHRHHQRDAVLQQRPGTAGGQPGQARRARRARHLQPLPVGLDLGGQHPVPPVEAGNLPRRRERPVPRALARRHQRPAARSASSTPTSSTWCPPCSTCSGSSRPPPSAVSRSQPLHGVSFAHTFDDAGRRRPATAPSTSRCSATARSTTTAGAPSARGRARPSPRPACRSVRRSAPRRWRCSTPSAGSSTTRPRTSRRTTTSPPRTGTRSSS